MLRTYWYVGSDIGYWPRRIPNGAGDLEKLILPNKALRKRLRDADDRDAIARDIAQGLKQRRHDMDQRSRGRKEVQSAIENRNRQIEFRRCGSIRFNLVTKRFGTEKVVDIQMTADIIDFAHMYDVAIILSGDADYLPAVASAKRKGKLVYGISFLGEDGNRLPGGAWRLDNLVDHRQEIPFDHMRRLMGIAVREAD